MDYKPKQRGTVIIDFALPKVYEIKKRRLALVMSSDNYNRSTNLVIVCPITTTEKEKAFLIPILSDKLYADGTTVIKVNTNQVFSLDYTEKANRNIQFVDRIEEKKFYHIV